jgi:NADPH2:quinone reductase
MTMSVPAAMRALQQTSLNGPRDLRLVTDAPVPAPGPGEVLVRVTAAGVNFGDIAQAHGVFPGGPQPPYLAGFEAAGEVVARGEAVTGLEPGTRVVGVGIGCGAFAQYAALPAVAVIPVPAGWAEPEALGLLVNWPTALAAVRTLGRVTAGETVLIHAAAGATGQAAVTLARHYGATVIAAAAPGKHETVQALGADHVLDSRRADLADEVLRLTAGHGADLVLESAGGAMLGASLAAARRVTGRVIVYGAAGGAAPVTNQELIYRHQVQLIGLNIGTLAQAAPQLYGEIMEELFALIAAGVLIPGQPACHDLADGPKALAELAARATTGKLALRP